jgi:hypothetical protein
LTYALTGVEAELVRHGGVVDTTNPPSHKAKQVPSTAADNSAMRRAISPSV